jgi:hypothetical protein
MACHALTGGCVRVVGAVAGCGQAVAARRASTAACGRGVGLADFVCDLVHFDRVSFGPRSPDTEVSPLNPGQKLWCEYLHASRTHTLRTLKNARSNRQSADHRNCRVGNSWLWSARPATDTWRLEYRGYSFGELIVDVKVPCAGSGRRREQIAPVFREGRVEGTFLCIDFAASLAQQRCKVGSGQNVGRVRRRQALVDRDGVLRHRQRVVLVCEDIGSGSARAGLASRRSTRRAGLITILKFYILNSCTCAYVHLSTGTQTMVLLICSYAPGPLSPRPHSGRSAPQTKIGSHLPSWFPCAATRQRFFFAAASCFAVAVPSAAGPRSGWL